MVIFYKKWKKYNEFQLTKNKMDLNIRKMTNHPPSPVTSLQTSTACQFLVPGKSYQAAFLVYRCQLAFL